MGLAIFTEAIIPQDSTLYHRMDAARKACTLAGVLPPKEVIAFFERENAEVKEDGLYISLYDHEAVEGEPLYGEGAIIDLSLLPPGTTKLRVFAG